MRGSPSFLASCAALWLIAVPAETWAQAKTAKACIEEWRADKANFQARGITEKAYVAQCRSGTATTAAPSPSAPTSPAPAPAPPRPTAAAPAQTPAPPERVPSTASPSAAGQFATEAQAKAACPGDTVVWANLRSKIYHFAGTNSYGNTMNGA
jgi:hypothetical protein